MKPDIHTFLCDDDGNRFFGEGPCRLLYAIDETGSLRKAAAQMNMAYSKASYLMKRAESCLGFALTEKTIGGRGGGGSCLTPEAKELLKKYEQYKLECKTAGREIYRKIFESGCE
jgi:molybdate transport system regulatory protein